MGSPPLGTAVLMYITVTLALAMSCNCQVEQASITSKVPALFVFGDSLLDTGNNDDLFTIAKAFSPPYGEDMRNGNGSSSSSGRFSNGRITTDFIAASLNLPCPPTYVSAGDNIEHGVNFASAGSGILDVTGDTFGDYFCMLRQIQNFEDVKNRLEEKVGIQNCSSIISKAIFYITTGSNDYFLTYYSTLSLYHTLSPAQFAHLLISKLKDHLLSLYKLGARKFAVTAIPPIGCTPYAFRQYPMNKSRDEDDGCISFMNRDVHAYNMQFFSSIQTLQRLFPDAYFISNNAYEAARLIYMNHTAYGITNVADACCSSQGGILCLPSSHICANPSHYFYFDGFHPTTTVHQLTALTYINGASPFVAPLNLHTLASLP